MAGPASHGQREILLVWNADLVIGGSRVTMATKTGKKKKKKLEKPRMDLIEPDRLNYKLSVEKCLLVCD